MISYCDDGAITRSPTRTGVPVEIEVGKSPLCVSHRRLPVRASTMCRWPAASPTMTTARPSERTPKAALLRSVRPAS